MFRSVTIDGDLRGDTQTVLSRIEVFVSGLEWLSTSALPGDETEISRLLLADREAILVSSFTVGSDHERENEQGVRSRLRQRARRNRPAADGYRAAATARYRKAERRVVPSWLSVASSPVSGRLTRCSGGSHCASDAVDAARCTARRPSARP
ncbi:hypothetical protein [Halolamina litorea]|uniref:Uncharacterized protein n=1 Tax=Halolamina litorea TaxID=1515593 RepID=A0ABD6BVH8_9EURY|nr:hypothetical protein [Halolamina litorea]